MYLIAYSVEFFQVNLRSNGSTTIAAYKLHLFAFDTAHNQQKVTYSIARVDSNTNCSHVIKCVAAAASACM